MKIKTVAHACCSIGVLLMGSGVHSQMYLPEGMPLNWIKLGTNAGIVCFILGFALKAIGHILLWVDSWLSLSVEPIVTATVNNASITLVERGSQ